MKSIISSALQAAEFSYQQEFHDLNHSDPNWSAWYANWLLSESEITDLLTPYFGINQLANVLNKLDGKYRSDYSNTLWSNLFAAEIANHIREQQ